MARAKGEKKERKTNITRSRTGCHTCRRRRVKCDEDKPSCKTCVRLGLTCDGYGYIVRYRFTRPTVLEEGPIASFDNVEWAPVAISCVNMDDMEISDRESVQEEESASSSRTPDSSLKEAENDQVEPPNWNMLGSPPQDLPNYLAKSGDDLTFDTSDALTLEEFYFSQWTTSVTPILPPVFADLTLTIPAFLPFRYAVLAVAASHLAHTGASIHSGDNGRYIPERTHRYRSLQYYGKGIRELAEYVNGFPDDTLDHLVATSLLFYYIEIDVGSIAGAVEQMELINQLHCSAQSHVKNGSIKLNPKLLSTWKSSRSLSINKRLTVGSGRSRPLAAIQPRDPKDSVGPGTTSYDTIAQLLCEVFATVRTVIVDFYVCRGVGLATEEQSRVAFGALVEHMSSRQNDSPGQPANVEESYMRSFEQNRKNLDDWHTQLDVSELPIESFTSASLDPIQEIDGKLHVQPLRFRSYEAAINYAYYASAQFSSSQKMLDRMTQFGSIKSDSTFTRENFPWESLLLRIACGLDLEDCLYKHTFKIGILSLLTCCASSCPHIAVANWISDWIGKLGKYGMAVEDGVPVALVLRVIRLIILMKSDGHDAFRISLMDSDIKEKEEFYRSNNDFFVAVCGKDRIQGRRYNNVVALPK